MKKITVLLAMAAMAVSVFAGCSKGNSGSGDSQTLNDVAVTDLRDEVKTAVTEENYFPNTEADSTYISDVLGVSDDMYDEIIAEIPMISINVDTLVIVKAKDGQADAVYEALDAYRTANIENAMQYPMNIGKINGSLVEKIGNYVVFAQLGGELPQDALDDDSVALEYCKEQNTTAIEAVKKALGAE